MSDVARLPLSFGQLDTIYELSQALHNLQHGLLELELAQRNVDRMAAIVDAVIQHDRAVRYPHRDD